MNLDQLKGRQTRLRHELAVAASSMPWKSGHIDRLTAELNAVDTEIEHLQGADAQPEAPSSRFPFFPLPTGEPTE